MSLDLFTSFLGLDCGTKVVGCIVCASGMGNVRKNLKLTNEEHTNRCLLMHGGSSGNAV